MDLVLVGITAISLVLAVVMGLIVFKLAREERLRSEARISLLREAAGDVAPMNLFESEWTSADSTVGEPATGVAGLFSNRETESAWPRRVGVALALALIVTAVGYVATRRQEGPPSSSSVGSPTSPLELIALQHTAEPDSLTISGTLLNPRGGASVSEIAVMAFAFGADGGVLASGRAPLDYRTLAPGEESNFVVKIAVRGTVSRYRVGFRRSDGSVVTHVDRRIDGPSARRDGSTEQAPWVR